MAFDDHQVSIDARNLLTEKSQAAGITLPHIRALIPQALELWARERMENPRYRQFFLKEITASASSGVVNLIPYTDGTSDTVELPDIRKATVYTSARIPMQWVNSYAQLSTQILRSLTHPTVFLEGTNLRICNTDGSLNSYSSSVFIAPIPAYPSAVGSVHTRLRQDFIAFLAEMAIGRYREMLQAVITPPQQENN